jgi:hypothetical protein
MFVLSCIQTRSCHADHCPTGVATQDPVRQRAIVVTDKAERVFYFHANTLHALADLVSAAGLNQPGGITPHQLMVRHAQGHTKSMEDSTSDTGKGQLLALTSGAKELPSPFAVFGSACSGEVWGVAQA